MLVYFGGGGFVLGWDALSIRFAANLVVIGGWLSVGGLDVLGWWELRGLFASFPTGF